MVVFATGGYHGTRFIKEAVFGVTPINPEMSILRHTSNSLLMSKEALQSAELRSDAQITDVRLGNKQVSGDIGIEFSYGSLDDFLAAAVRGIWSNNSLKAGLDETSFTIERAFTDIDQYQVFTGCRVNMMSLTVATNAMVTGSIGIVGQNSALNGTSLDPTPTSISLAPPFDGFTGTVWEGGTESKIITEISIEINNTIEPAFVIGSVVSAALVAGRINITGTLSTFFKDSAMIKKFDDEVESSIIFYLGDGVHESYKVTLPRVKFTGADNPVDGEGPITLNVPFQALYDECTNTNIIIERFPPAVVQPCVLNYDGTELLESTSIPDTVSNIINGTLTGGVSAKIFNGAIGAEIPGVTWTGVPHGLVGSVIKSDNSKCAITLNGTATTPITVGVDLKLSFSEEAFLFGYCPCLHNEITGTIAKSLTLKPAP